MLTLGAQEMGRSTQRHGAARHVQHARKRYNDDSEELYSQWGYLHTTETHPPSDPRNSSHPPHLPRSICSNWATSSSIGSAAAVAVDSDDCKRSVGLAPCCEVGPGLCVEGCRDVEVGTSREDGLYPGANLCSASFLHVC